MPWHQERGENAMFDFDDLEEQEETTAPAPVAEVWMGMVTWWL